MKVGDLVKHRDGDIGIIVNIQNKPRWECQVWFGDDDVDWFFWSWLDVLS